MTTKRPAKQEPETKTSGIKVTTQTIVTITTTNGLPIKRGDLIALKIRGEDILCVFLELNAGGYFVTESAINPKQENKYRTGSIEACYKVSEFGLKQEPEDKPESAYAVDPADVEE